MPRILRNHHVIAVHDLDACRDWYERVLGFRGELVGENQWLFLRRDNLLIMAGLCPDAIAPTDLGDHQYFAYLVVDDVDAVHDTAVREHADILKPPRTEPWGMRELALRTADGHRIMVGQEVSSAAGTA